MWGLTGEGGLVRRTAELMTRDELRALLARLADEARCVRPALHEKYLAHLYAPKDFVEAGTNEYGLPVLEVANDEQWFASVAEDLLGNLIAGIDAALVLLEMADEALAENRFDDLWMAAAPLKRAVVETAKYGRGPFDVVSHSGEVEP